MLIGALIRVVPFQLQSQEELLQSLTQQLRGVQQEKALMEEEFTQYRKHAQVEYATHYNHRIYYDPL